MKYLAITAILLLCAGFAAWQLTWLAWSLRGLLFFVAIAGLVFVVIRSK